MDRDARVRAARRRQALDALAFEQDREAILVEQIEDVAAELEGAQLDAHLFAQMSSEEARLVRDALGHDPDDEADGDELEGSADDGVDTEDDEAEAEDLETEIARLEEVLESSRLVRAALERYVALLAEPPIA